MLGWPQRSPSVASLGDDPKGERADLNLGLGSGLTHSGFASAAIQDDYPRSWNSRCRRSWRYVDCSTLLIFHSSRTTIEKRLLILVSKLLSRLLHHRSTFCGLTNRGSRVASAFDFPSPRFGIKHFGICRCAKVRILAPHPNLEGTSPTYISRISSTTSTTYPASNSHVLHLSQTVWNHAHIHNGGRSEESSAAD